MNYKKRTESSCATDSGRSAALRMDTEERAGMFLKLAVGNRLSETT